MDSNHLIPYKPGTSKAVQSDPSRSGSEADSLLDLYGRPRSHVDNTDQSKKADYKEALYMDDEDPEQSRWIHRDKLALIESHEMQEAGIKLPRLPRSGSKSNRRKDHSRQHSREQYGNGVAQDDPISHDGEAETGPGQSHRSSNGREEEQTQEGELGSDLQSPAEIVQESSSTTGLSPVYSQQGTRGNSSRIPLSKSSPLPIPQEHIERNTPLTRTRGASENWSIGDEDGTGYIKGRRRSHSVGSQVLLDDGELSSDAPHPVASSSNNGSPSTSPTKRLGVKSGQVSSSSARKATGALRNVSDPQKTRNTSATYRSSPNQRPKSRSGLESRPATAVNRPEGDPPWLATMYKPDPRLPPDQQIIPTHAKRMQQEKDEASGRLGGNFDLRGADVEDKSQPSSPKPPNLEAHGKSTEVNDEPGWPLRATGTAKGDGIGDPAGAAEQHAGYTTIPKVQNTPSIGQASEAATAAGPQSSTTIPQEQSKKASRGCGCCVVM